MIHIEPMDQEDYDQQEIEAIKEKILKDPVKLTCVFITYFTKDISKLDLRFLADTAVIKDALVRHSLSAHFLDFMETVSFDEVLTKFAEDEWDGTQI